MLRDHHQLQFNVLVGMHCMPREVTVVVARSVILSVMRANAFVRHRVAIRALKPPLSGTGTQVLGVSLSHLTK